MFQETLIDEILRGELRREMESADLQPTNLADLFGTVIQILTEVVGDGTSGRARSPRGDGQIPGGWLNLVPSESLGPCAELLLGFCFDGDSFGTRLREVAYHAGIHCPETKLVILTTSKWDPNVWKRDHADAFADLNARLVVLLAVAGRLLRIL